jgi:GntR family transcriptional repressor for pyruvate dehydrogenase complex
MHGLPVRPLNAVATGSRTSDFAIEPVEHAPVYGQVVEQIRRAVHMGTYIPGDKLPPERELAKHLGVSRTTVREAIRVLEGEGYVDTRRGASGGVIVLDRGQTEQRAGRIIKESLAELMQVIDFRLAVECRAARLAAERRTEEDIAKLTAAFSSMEPGQETARFRAADSSFHLGIAEAAQNAWMRRAIEDARAAMWVPLDRYADHVFVTAQAHHAQILQSLFERDVEAAEQAVAAHIETTRRDLERIASAAD